VRESKVTVKIPRPLYRKIQQVVEDSGFNSPTDFIVYVLRDLMGEAVANSGGPGSEALEQHGVSPSDLTQDELDGLRRKLENLGYL
jgi:Arc/MetJ-type ribon-helix-helix transcriptional regulator